MVFKSLINIKIIVGFLLIASAQISQAALLGTTLSLETLFQQTLNSVPDTIGFLTTATVVEPGVEFPSLQALEVAGGGLGTGLVDVAINAGDNFLEIDFSNAASGTFAPAFFNGYVFTFDNATAVTFTGATIDTSVTTLGLTSSDISFTGNQLSINVEGLSFNTSTFARINLDSVGGPGEVPLPAAVWLFGSGLIGLIGFARRKKA